MKSNTLMQKTTSQTAAFSLKNFASKKLLGLTAALIASAIAFHAPTVKADSVNIHPASNITGTNLAGVNISVAFAVAPPFITLKDSLTAPSGIDADIVYELQRRTGFSFTNNKVEIMNFKEMIEFGASGKADIIAGAITLSDERKKIFSVSQPYLSNSLCIVARKNDNIKTLSDLNNKTIAVIYGSDLSGLGQANNINITTVGVPSPFMSFFSVARNRADAVIIDEIVAAEYVNLWKDTQLEIKSTIPNTESSIGILFRKNSKNSEILNRAFNDMLRDGTIDKIIKKHLQNYIFSTVTE